jgi:hypothetical protein
MAEHSDAHIIGRLIERTRLLIALSDDIPTETKLQTQGVLKQFAAAVLVPEEEQDQEQVQAYYDFLYNQLSPYADPEALLYAMRNFIHYLTADG